jgi:hypothetical protein
MSKEIDIVLPLSDRIPSSACMREQRDAAFKQDQCQYTDSVEGLGRTVSLRIRRVDLSSEYSLLCIPGEVFCEYSLMFKRMYKGIHIIPLGYTNGMVGYIPTRDGVTEGGYETDRTYEYYGLPSPFAEGVEEAVVQGVRKLYEQ